MKKIVLFAMMMSVIQHLAGQGNSNEKQKQDIQALIDQYSLAREKKDTILLKSILTEDVDQLVSSGEWRVGIKPAVQGMLRSSQNSSGARSIIIDKIRFLSNQCAIVDARYEIQNSDGSPRKMWSTFVVVNSKGKWKISAIRNMLPAVP